MDNTLKLWHPIPEELQQRSLQEEVQDDVARIVSQSHRLSFWVWNSELLVMDDTHGDMVIRDTNTGLEISLWQEAEFWFFAALVKGSYELWYLEEILFPEWGESLYSWMERHCDYLDDKHERDLEYQLAREKYPTVWDTPNIGLFRVTKWRHRSGDYYDILVDPDTQEIVFSFDRDRKNYSQLDFFPELLIEQQRVSVREVRAYLQALFLFGRDYCWGRTNPGRYRHLLEYMFSDKMLEEMKWSEEYLRKRVSS